MKIKESLQSILSVVSRLKYLAILLVVSFIFFSFGVIPRNISLLFSLLGKTTILEYFNVVLSLYHGWFNETLLVSIIILITISILVGVTISLMVFKINSRKKFSSSASKSGSAGIILGILVPACIPCGMGLLSLLGLSSLLFFLPYQGLEIGIVSIAFLLYSILVMGKDINNCRTCQVEIKAGRK